jgi:cytochrome c biogenesis protein CcdA/thioredoxin-related protein
MKKVLLLVTLLLTVLLNVNAQDMPSSVDEVIDWDFNVEYGDCNDATIVITVNQKDGWHIYAQKQPEGGISAPTELNFAKSGSYKKTGRTKEYGAELHGEDTKFPERTFPGKKAIFKQKIEITSEKDFTIELKYFFMACLDGCFPPEERVEIIPINGTDCLPVVESEVEVITEPSEVTSKIGFQTYALKNSNTEYELRIRPQITEDWKLEMSDSENPLEIEFKGDFKSIGKLSLAKSKDGFYTDSIFSQLISIENKDSNQLITGSLSYSGVDQNGNGFKSNQMEFSIPLKDAIIQSIGDDTSKRSYWGIFWAAFAGGLVALLTPCVFPMIPMTVSFFTKGSENRRKGIFKGVMYGFFILLIYVLLSVPFHLLDSLDPSILNQIATFGPLNIFFFAMLFIFALSFLGAFEIVLPAKWTNNADKKSDLGGLLGIFFMALTLALVSFSCTGPILGSLLASASGGGAWSLTWGMAGFGLALGLPFALFAIFPSWLNGLPSSGGWLNNVKVFLGFLELALAFKFLSNADLAWDAHLLERELFIAIWIGIFGALTFYLFGLFQTKHDSPITGGLGSFRIVMGTLVLIFTIYLIPGLFGAPLKLISAFPPPQSYSEIPYGIHGQKPESDGEMPEGAHFEHGLMVFKDFDLAKAYADQEGKPLMLDFTGHQCVNCRKMEANVWSVDKVHELMNNDFVVVSLYVDDKELLPASEISPYSGRELISVGDKWSDMQSVLYKKNTQPQYVALDKSGEIMNSDATYKSHKDPVLFEKWLNDAKVEYEKRGDIKTYYGSVIYVVNTVEVIKM